LVAVVLGLVEVQNDTPPRRKRAVCRPDVEGDRIRCRDDLAVGAEVIQSVARPDASLLADPAAFRMLLLHFMLLNNATVVLAHVPGADRAHRIPLDAEGTTSAAPLQELLCLAVRAWHMQPEQVRRFARRRLDLAGAFDLWGRSPDRFRE